MGLLPPHVGIAVLACVATAFGSGGADAATGAASAFAIPDGLGLDRLAAMLINLLSVPLVIGFAIGVLAGEFGRIAWTAGQGAMKTFVTFGAFAARYGVAAVLLAAVLYFI